MHKHNIQKTQHQLKCIHEADCLYIEREIKRLLVEIIFFIRLFTASI